jgi:hypothetical protein
MSRPVKTFDTDDPLALVGATSDSPVTDEAVEEMGRAFVDEFARMGWGRERLLALFRNPFYRGPHLVWRLKGEAWVRELTDQFGGSHMPREAKSD